MRRLPRWRPICPECGYAVRGNVSAVCPECGSAYPTTRRSYRRWAVLRLPWERRHRLGWLNAYVATLVLVLLRPRHSAFRVAVPDRLGVVLGFAIINVLLAAAIRSACSEWHLALWRGNDVAKILGWHLWSFVAWVSIGALMLLIGAAIGQLLYRSHPAGATCAVKWALYTSALLLWCALAWAGTVLWFDLRNGPGLPNWGIGSLFLTGYWNPGPGVPPVIWLLPVWWGVGLGKITWVRTKSCGTCILGLTVWALTWYLVSSGFGMWMIYGTAI